MINLGDVLKVSPPTVSARTVKSCEGEIITSKRVRFWFQVKG